MDFDIFNNLENDMQENKKIEKFIQELEFFLNLEENDKNTEQIGLNPNRKENHLYLVTEDRNGEVYLWDFTEKAEKEFLESNLPTEVLAFATEGAMLQFKNGEYTLYSPDGYDIIENNEENLTTEETNSQNINCIDVENNFKEDINRENNK